jgi:glycosyltransferase involved in cell wall biosynthesis
MQISGKTSKPASAKDGGKLKVAVLIPCHNEALTVAPVITGFRAALPDAAIYVYDNNSTDETLVIARANGALIGREIRQGKGHVVRRMFRDIEADVFVLVDGDATYDAPSAPRLIDALLDGGYAMVVGARVTSEDLAYRLGHQFGNRVLTGFVAAVFGTGLRDMLSGYRIFSRRFVKSFPALSSGFEIETELTVRALELELPIIEIDTPYFSRPEGSVSKLNTWSDGLRILLTIVELYRSERPLAFFSLLGAALAGLSILLSIPLIATYLETGLVPRIPTAILSTGLMILAFLSVAVGFVLDTVTRGRREVKLLAYLSHPAPGRAPSTVDR